MKKLTAYFSNAQAAGLAAFDLAENFSYCNDITVLSADSGNTPRFFSKKAPLCAKISVVLPYEKSGTVSYLLRKKGALKTVISGDTQK